MSVIEIIKSRHSVRKFLAKPIEEEKLNQVLEAARLAPSWRNRQCWKFIVVKDTQIKKSIIQNTSVYNQSWLGKEPIIIVACGNPELSGFKNDQYYYLVDVAIAMEHLVLAATALGLGTCWIGSFDEQKIKQILKIPDKIRIVTITPLGYPANKEGIIGTIVKKIVKSKTRKSLTEVACIDRWAEGNDV